MFSSFQECLVQDIKNWNLDSIPLFSDVYLKQAGTDAEKKTVTDQILRNLIRDKIASESQRTDTATESLLDVITASVSVAKQGMVFRIFFSVDHALQTQAGLLYIIWVCKVWCTIIQIGQL